MLSRPRGRAKNGAQFSFFALPLALRFPFFDLLRCCQVEEWKIYLTLINICCFYASFSLILCEIVSRIDDNLFMVLELKQKENSPCRRMVDFWGHCRRRPMNSGNASIDTAHASGAINLWSCWALKKKNEKMEYKQEINRHVNLSAFVWCERRSSPRFFWVRENTKNNRNSLNSHFSCVHVLSRARRESLDK